MVDLFEKLPIYGPVMIGPIERFLTADHARLDKLLERATPPDGSIDEAVFAEFREGLLRHIGMEEKVLFRMAKELQGGEPLSMAKAMRKDHGDIAALLVPSPTHAGCQALREILARHNPLEEGPGGLYATCDALAGDGAEAVVERMRAQPKVPVSTYYDGPLSHNKRHAGR
jgi:hypothetical protein